jgi:pimeloyl-ACP methyl ester carboxylesterase
MARDLERLVATLRMTEFDLVGYSMGAVVSLIAASGDDRVRRLVVGGVGAGIVELGGVDTRAMPVGLLAEGLEAEDPATIDHPEVVAFRAFADAVGGDRRALAAQARAAHSAPIALDRIGAPVLVIAGDDDRLARRPEVLVDALPDARLLSVPGDHVTALVDPRFASGVVEFLA